MEKIKKIKTKESKRLLFLDIGMVVACIIYMKIITNLLGLTENFSIIEWFFMIMKETMKYLAMVKTINGLITVVLLWLILVALGIAIVALFTFPLNVVCLAIRNIYKNSIKERTTFKEITGLEYYRENFEGVSPATISIITDLKVEYNKDVAATIMKLYLNKNIDFKDDQIEVLSLNTSNLKQSEISILNKIAGTGNKKIFEVLEHKSWNNLCMEEAQKEGYIVNKRSKKRFIIKLIILVLLFAGCKNLFNSYDTVEKETDDLFSGYEENISDEELINNPEILEDMIVLFKLVAVVIAGALMIGLPIYIIVYVISYQKKKEKFVRTKKGKILLEQIYGMKKFIHDFSNLDAATKEQIILWDYFLIYAIVLEENTKIIDEICKCKKVKMPTIM